MTTVHRWTGREAKLLREASRLSIRDFADRLGVGARTINKWEARLADITPLPQMQQVLDTALAQATDDVKAWFAAATRAEPAEPDTAHLSEPARQPAGLCVASPRNHGPDRGQRSPGAREDHRGHHDRPGSRRGHCAVRYGGRRRRGCSRQPARLVKQWPSGHAPNTTTKITAGSKPTAVRATRHGNSQRQEAGTPDHPRPRAWAMPQRGSPLSGMPGSG